MNKPLVIIVGPTAVGKTDISLEIAKKLNGNIISADSMQIYKHLNIGSAKPTKEEMGSIKHYLIDEINPTMKFSVAEYQNMAKKYIDKTILEDKLPIVVGGTGLYVNSLIYDMDFGKTREDCKIRETLEKEAAEKGINYIYDKLKEVDKEAARRIHPNNVQRVIRALEIVYNKGNSIKDFSKDIKENKDYQYVLIGLNRDRSALHKRINMRVDIMLKEGLIDEVKELINMGLTEHDISMKGIGYKEVIGYLQGKYDILEAERLIKRNSRRYAKRQITWFKRYDQIQWFTISDDSSSNDKIIKDIIYFIEGNLDF